ncbi:MAG: hypothetical protein LBC84_05665 [Prevotellaceae bacterium]|jgi:hypothetical protein|nr:hypothetical protein [Prevotellaceae bacterium]
MRKGFCLLLFSIGFLAIYAQEQTSEEQIPAPRYLLTQKRYTIALQPFQWINYGWRFDFEMRLGEGPGWLQFGPTLYLATRDKDADRSHHFYDGNYDTDYYYYYNFREPFSELRGGGLDVNYKHFLNPKRSLYAAGGLSYTLLNIDYYGGLGKWVDYVEDGLSYHEYRYTIGMFTQSINRLATNFYFGYQVPSRHMFLFDMFVGMSYRYPFMDKSKPAFDRGSFSFGYEGWVMMMGVRFGIGIK